LSKLTHTVDSVAPLLTQLLQSITSHSNRTHIAMVAPSYGGPELSPRDLRWDPSLGLTYQ